MPDVQLFYFLLLILWVSLTQTAKAIVHNPQTQAAVSSQRQKKSVLTGAAEPQSLPFSALSHSHTYIWVLWNSFGDARWAPGIIVIANPDIIELQSDRATPGAARTITLRPGSQWKTCIRGKTSVYQMLKNREVLADNVSIQTRVITAGLRGGLTPLIR